MLPKTHRVSKKLFEKIIRSGKTLHSPHLSVRIIEMDEPDGPRATYAISKKIAARATERNYLKRKGLILVKKYLNSISSHSALIFFPKKGIQELSSDDHEEEIKTLLEKVRTLSLPIPS